MAIQKFIGIRYARAERWQTPIQEPKLHSLNEVSTQYLISPQGPCRLDSMLGSTSEPTQSEDSLRLAIYTPSTKESLPVLVFIHGGAFTTGSGLYDIYNGERLAANGNFVVVCISYRLGALGFLYDPDKNIVNLGLQDQACAMHWVKENISLFGGNNQRITIMGQSAGGYSILAHIAQMQEPLFSKAIIMSAPFIQTGKNKMRRQSERFCKLLTKDTTHASLEQVLEAQTQLEQQSLGMAFTPVCSKMLKPTHIIPGLKQLLLTHQAQDAAPFVPFKQLVGPATRMIFDRPLQRYAKQMQRNGIATSTLRLDWRSGIPPWGATHCIELPLLFGSWQKWQKAPFLQGVDEAEFLHQSAKLQETIISFVYHD